MDFADVKELVELMKRSDLSELEIEKEGMRVRILRGHSGQVTSSTHFIPPPSLPGPAAPSSAPAQLESSAPAAEEGVFIKSPMVGTFYRSPSPDSPSYVEPNSKVTEKTVVCIIEAMKVMNEIQAEMKGTILEVLVENGQAVEFGQPLYKIKPA